MGGTEPDPGSILLTGTHQSVVDLAHHCTLQLDITVTPLLRDRSTTSILLLTSKTQRQSVIPAITASARSQRRDHILQHVLISVTFIITQQGPQLTSLLLDEHHPIRLRPLLALLTTPGV